MRETEPRRRYQVFISSTFEDLRDDREEIMQALLRINCIPAGMEMFPAANATQWDLIEHMIDDSDYVIVVVAQRYGSVDPAAGISYTQKEFEYAERTQKPILVFPKDLSAEETAALDPMLLSFRHRLSAGNRHVRFWQATSQLPGFIAADLAVAVSSPPYPEGWVRGGYATTDHIQLLRATVATLLSNFESTAAQIARVNDVVSSTSTRVAALLELVTMERRGIAAMSHYMHVQQLKLNLIEQNPMFGSVADKLLEDPLMTLERLAEGHASVPEYQIGQANDVLIASIQSRFDAASHDDLTFWLSTAKVDVRYRHAVYDATRRPLKPIVATRMFVLPARKLRDNAEDLASVLTEQIAHNVGVAVVIEDDLSDKRDRDAVLDFALFDGGKAVSYFRRYRTFDVTFQGIGKGNNDREIERQVRTYNLLLSNCWLASAQFAEHSLARTDEPAALLRASSRTRALEAIDHPHAKRLFPIVIETASDVREAIDELVTLHSRIASHL
jgi:hypothetical protein